MDDQWGKSLAADARKLRNFLYDVDSTSTSLWRGPALDAAIHRYVEIFLPMLAAHAGLPSTQRMTKEANRKLNTAYERALVGYIYQHELPHDERRSYTKPFRKLGLGQNVVAVAPIPPLDVAFCWALHRLSPLDYIADCKQLFGAPLPTDSGLDYICAQNAGEERALIARLQWFCFAKAARKLEPFQLFTFKTCRRERKTFLPSYLWPPYEEDGKQMLFRFNERTRPLEKTWEPPLSYDLKAAAARQKQFVYNVSHEYFDDDEALKRGAKRYRQFLALMRDNPGVFAVPMYDIDLVWHAHMLRETERYAEDTRNFVGRFVNHKEDDDRRKEGELDMGFTRTAELWKDKYGEEYIDENTSYRGRIGGNVEHLFGISRTKTIQHDNLQRESFVRRATGCNSCTVKTYCEMHGDCREKLAKALRVARGGQVRGGACAALYSLGYIDSVTTYAQPGGACGACDAFNDRVHNKDDCVNGVFFAAGGGAGAGGCAGSEGGCGGDGGGCGGSCGGGGCGGC